MDITTVCSSNSGFGMVRSAEIQKVSFNTVRPGNAHKRQLTGSSVTQVMACRWFSTETLSVPMQTSYYLDIWE